MIEKLANVLSIPAAALRRQTTAILIQGRPVRLAGVQRHPPGTLFVDWLITICPITSLSSLLSRTAIAAWAVREGLA